MLFIKEQKKNPCGIGKARMSRNNTRECRPPAVPWGLASEVQGFASSHLPPGDRDQEGVWRRSAGPRPAPGDRVQLRLLRPDPRFPGRRPRLWQRPSATHSANSARQVLLRPRGSPPAADPNHGSPAPAQGEHRVLRVPLCVKRGPSSL